jgi:NAD(P)-dependent dehydrogenase (short-subunit alcohol dehydrogenase family)
MKIILVTGGNRGIGLEICRQLDELGHAVIMGSRDEEKGRQAALDFSDRLIVRQLDVTDEESIENALEFVRQAYGRLDVLINNAGLGASAFGEKRSALGKMKDFAARHLPGAGEIIKKSAAFLREGGLISHRDAPSSVSLDQVGIIMETNLYGPWRMIQAFTDLLEQSPQGRIINISSGMGALGSLSGDYAGYRQSKASLNALTIMLAAEMKKTRVNAMCPGWVRTDMGGPNAPRSVSQGADTAVWLATEREIPTGKFFRDRQEIPW